MRREPGAPGARRRLLMAGRVLPAPDRLLASGGVLVDGAHVAEVLEDVAAVRRRAASESLPVEDLGRGVLAPALIDAHAHLELGALAGRVPAGNDFLEWVRALVVARRACHPAELHAGAARDAARLLATGTAAVGDIDTSCASPGTSATETPRVLVYRELLDLGDRRRARATVARARVPLPHSEVRRAGLSPHAPHTVSRGLWRLAGKLAAGGSAAPFPVSIHWSETAAEVEWLLAGTGPWAPLLARSPGCSGLDLIEEAGLLRPGTSLVHANHPLPGEIERVARAGAVLVHCPGSHAFFGRGASRVGEWLRAGAVVGLGTDSSASNETLDMRREMRLLRASEPGLDPARVFEIATEGSARALCWPGLRGRIEPGGLADLAYFECEASSHRELLDELTAGMPPVGGVWVGGRRAPSALDPQERVGRAGGGGGD